MTVVRSVFAVATHMWLCACNVLCMSALQLLGQSTLPSVLLNPGPASLTRAGTSKPRSNSDLSGAGRSAQVPASSGTEKGQFKRELM